MAAQDCQVHVSFHTTATVQVSANAVATVQATTRVLTVNTLTGGYVPQDQLRDFDVDVTHLYFSVEGDQSGYWIGQVSSKF